MTPEVDSWIEKAEQDLLSAGRELPHSEAPNYDLVCFLAQQCTEKYLKALLQLHNAYFEKSHDLVYLLKLIAPYYPSFTQWRNALDELNAFAVQFRYPGASATYGDADAALNYAKRIRDLARAELGL